MGEVVHKSLAWLYRTQRQQVSITKAGLLSYFLETWDAQVSPAVRVIRANDSLKHQRARAVHMLDQYFERIYLKDRKETLEIEYRFQLVLNGKYRFEGVIDRLARNKKGRLFVIDYKASKRGARGLDEDTDLQLDAYGLWALLKAGVGGVNLTFELLQDGAKYTIDLKRGQANAVVSELVARIEEVRRETRFAARPSPLCAWCEYRGVCPDRWRGYASGAVKATS